MNAILPKGKTNSVVSSQVILQTGVSGPEFPYALTGTKINTLHRYLAKKV